MKKSLKTENEFQECVLNWLQRQIRNLSKKPKYRKVDFRRIKAIKSEKIVTGVAIYQDSENFYHGYAKRESDITVGFFRTIKEDKEEPREVLLPLVAFELKITRFGSGEMLKKNEIYRKFRDVYPWISGVFLIHDGDFIELNHNNTLHHLTSFDLVLKDFGAKSKKLIHATLENRIDYVLNYWSF